MFLTFIIFIYYYYFIMTRAAIANKRFNRMFSEHQATNSIS